MRALLFCCGLVLVLSACGGDKTSPVPTAYSLPQSKGGKLCAEQCSKSRNYCGWSCDLDYRACYIDLQEAAQKRYEQYADARLTANQTVDKMPGDFLHPAACDAAKKSCKADCDGPYNACYSSCGGTITTP
jgi:hypothetical protein